MKFIHILLFIFTLQLVSPAQSLEESSISFINKLQRQQFDSCYVMFDTSLANKFDAGMLKSMWQSLPKYMGEYKSYSTIETSKKDSVYIVAVRCEFEKMKIDLQFSYNANHKIIGMYFVPPKSKTTYIIPEYAKQNKYYETKIAVTTGAYTLPGALCVPSHVKNPPVAILLAGSGPQDKDESIGPNKILKDLAVGLASNGIATYRYDKRTLTYGAEINKKIDKFDLHQEVVEDAISAINTLKKNPDFKNSKFYVIGHSLGAMTAPLVASKAKNVSGIVLLAGNARPLEDLLFEQYNYIFGLDSIDANEKIEIEKIITQVKTVKNPKLLKVAKSSDLPFGLPSYYWQSFTKYNQLQVAKKLKQPILVLQGERDYQVTMVDFNLWKQNLSENSKNKFISYPTLNHIFIYGEGKSTPTEYEKQGNIEEKVITDISAWIKAN